MENRECKEQGGAGVLMENKELKRIKELREAGWSYRAIGNEVLMSRERVSSICKQKGWAVK